MNARGNSIKKPSQMLAKVFVAGAGLEPTTFGL